MIQKESTLEEILAHVWGMISRGSADAKHSYHFPVLATSLQGEVRQRTLILRDSDIQNRQLICFTDKRTQKVSDIHENPNVSWLFYDHQHKEQIRAVSKAKIYHTDDISHSYWKNIPNDKRGDYQGSYPPGKKLDHYVDNLPESKEGTSKDNEAGFENFAVIISEVHTIDFLKLMHDGHLRTQFQWKHNAWEKFWLAP